MPAVIFNTCMELRTCAYDACCDIQHGPYFVDFLHDTHFVGWLEIKVFFGLVCAAAAPANGPPAPILGLFRR
jgi:hypothetical protein